MGGGQIGVLTGVTRFWRSWVQGEGRFAVLDESAAAPDDSRSYRPFVFGQRMLDGTNRIYRMGIGLRRALKHFILSIL